METISEKKVSHTPGPWKLRKFRPDNCRLTRASDVPQLDYGVSTDDCDYTICQHTTKANAKLIAAAPELLSALRKVIQHTRPSQFEGKIPDLHLNEIEKAYYAAQEAINKATE